MQAVIMAGGKGTRLASVTRDLIPKPMVPFCGKPLIERIIERLAANGVRDVVVCVGYLGEQITSYFSETRVSGVNLRFVSETEPLGSAGALYYAKEYLSEDFLFVYGDLIFDVDIARMFRFHRSKNGLATLFVHPNSHPYDSDLVRCDEEGRVLGFEYKDREQNCDYANLVNAGMAIFSPEIFQFLPKPQKISLEEGLLADALLAGNELWSYRSPEFIKDVGTPDRLVEAEREWESGKIAARNLKNRQKAIFLDRDGTINEFVGLVTSPDQIRLIPSAAEAIRLINRSGYLAIVATNQPVVARGECSLDELSAIHRRLDALLGNEGAFLDDLVFCPHHPDKGYPGEIPQFKIECDCRKPKPGMLTSAAKKYNIDLNVSWMIGDAEMDVAAGINAGTKTALVHSRATKKAFDLRPTLECERLIDAVRIILDQEKP